METDPAHRLQGTPVPKEPLALYQNLLYLCASPEKAPGHGELAEMGSRVG